MAFIPVEKMKSLREAAKNGDPRAKQILKMQMDGEDFSSLLEEHFKAPTEIKKEETVVANPEIHNEITDPKLKKFLEYNGVKPGDPEYNDTVEAYYQEFPKARPGAQKNLEMKATETDVDVKLPDDEEDNHSIYDEEDGDVTFDSPTQHYVEEQKQEISVFDKLMNEELDAIHSYDEAILEIMKSEEHSDTEKKGIIAKLEEIKRDEAEHFEELKHLKESSVKKEESAIE